MKKIIIISSLVVIFLLFVSLLFVFRSKNTPTFPGVIPTPTAIPISIIKKQIPTGTSPTPQINYKQNSEEKLINGINNRQPLSANDTQAKNTISNSLNNQSGSPKQTNEFRVDYLHSNDLFQVEILTTNIDQAKKDAIQWFLSQGFTQEGLCKLPVSFYLNFDVKQQLKQSGTQVTFNPLPDFCQ
jgi:hypothetical protein